MKTIAIFIVLFIGLLLASCNSYQRCPAYGAAEIETVGDKV
jgi:hypothetical protein